MNVINWFLGWIWIVPVFLLMLGVLVLVHEAGHFFTALLFKIKVEEFGLGFPPRAFAVRRNGIDYSINWLPIGGFVKIVGENGDSDDPHSFGKAPAWQRIIVLAAGSAMNVLLALIIFTVMAISGTREVDAPLTGVSAVTANQAAAKGGMVPGDRIVSVAGQPVSDSETLRSLSKQHAGQPTQFVVMRNGQQQTLTITPDPNSTAPLGIGLTNWVSTATVSNVKQGGVGDKAGLKDGDVIVSINGTPVDNLPLASYLLSETKSPPKVVVKRGDATVGPLTLDVADKQPYGFGFNRPYRTVYYSPTDAIGRALSNTWDVVSSLPKGLAQAFAGQSQGPGVTGPIGIAQLTGEVAQEAGLNGLLNLTALLGISLFMLNMLPLPGLDGGRLLLVLIEVVRGGRRIAPDKEAMVHAAGIMVLLGFLLIISFFDIQRIVGGSSILP